ncbi:hypothetical protein [Kribbella koreensis]|uniref:hypothetical protein n=1 Tax=Kribbella koreensis TaxID=57909 RepID=UPI0031D4852E
MPAQVLGQLVPDGEVDRLGVTDSLTARGQLSKIACWTVNRADIGGTATKWTFSARGVTGPGDAVWAWVCRCQSSITPTSAV